MKKVTNNELMPFLQEALEECRGRLVVMDFALAVARKAVDAERKKKY